MWTCPACSRSFVNRHQWHSCVELSLDAALADASDRAVALYGAVAAAIGDCGVARVHPQRTRIAFISSMTFASVALARRWVDVTLITESPIDDPRIRSLECYGPTSFAHTVRLVEVTDLDDDVRRWLCRSLRRGDRTTLDPTADVEPLAGRPLELVTVPLRCELVRRDGRLALRIPRYAADVFAAHPEVVARIGRDHVGGRVRRGGGGWSVDIPVGTLEAAGLGEGEMVDAFLRADL